MIAKKSVLRRMAFFAQRILLHISYCIARIRTTRKSKPISWVVGVEEIAACVKYISEAIPNSCSVSLAANPFYDFPYQYCLVGHPGLLTTLRRIAIGPILLGRLAARAQGFLYVGASGFLLDYDQRAFEFNFLSKRQIRIACFFCGSDIRSPRLMRELEREMQLENIATYLPQLSSPDNFNLIDNEKRRVAEVAERHARVIFTASVDQKGYFTRKTYPYLYFYPDEKFHRNPDKFHGPTRIRVVHAPTNQAIKGTQLVRAAVAKLRRENYQFDYIELIGVKNTVVLETLRSAHIVLNEFYAFVPGLFGVEAMASYCVLLTSADEEIERDLPRGSNRAWVVTKYYEIYDRLKEQLDHPESLAAQAELGHQWALEHGATSNSGRRIREALDAS